MDSEAHEGYVQNIKDINESAFTFDLQGSSSSTRFVCFSLEKRKEIDDKVKSPVKVKKVKLSTKGKDVVYSAQSEIEDTELDFVPINYDDVTISQLHMVGDGSLIDIEVRVIEKVGSRTTNNRKKIDSYVVGDETGNCKFTVWNDCAGVVAVGSSYKLINARAHKDIYGALGLSTPSKGFKMEKTTKDIVTTAAAAGPSGQLINIKKGEIKMVDTMSRYKICPKCGKKLPQTTEKTVTCSNCGAEPKMKFCGDGMFVRFDFIEENGVVTKLTMFQDQVRSLVANADNLTDPKLIKKLANLDDMKVIIGQGDTVNGVELLN